METPGGSWEARPYVLAGAAEGQLPQVMLGLRTTAPLDKVSRSQNFGKEPAGTGHLRSSVWKKHWGKGGGDQRSSFSKAKPPKNGPVGRVGQTAGSTVPASVIAKKLLRWNRRKMWAPRPAVPKTGEPPCGMAPRFVKKKSREHQQRLSHGQVQIYQGCGGSVSSLQQWQPKSTGRTGKNAANGFGRSSNTTTKQARQMPGLGQQRQPTDCRHHRKPGTQAVEASSTASDDYTAPNLCAPALYRTDACSSSLVMFGNSAL